MPYVDIDEIKGKEIVFEAMRFGIEPVLSCWAEVLHEADAYHLFKIISMIKVACENSVEFTN